jgi:hypothetical protein
LKLAVKKDTSLYPHIDSFLVADGVQERFIRPIINASYPGTLGALSLTVYRIMEFRGGAIPVLLKNSLLIGATAFLLSAFCMFFYSLYPTHMKLWTATAILFLAGLFLTITSVLLLFAV